MAQTLIVANRTVGGGDLAAAVRARSDPARRFLLLVPVAAPSTAVVAIGAAAADMTAPALVDLPDEHQLACDRLAFGLEWLLSLGAAAAGQLSTEPDTVDAVAALVADTASSPGDRIDEVIVSTLPSTVSRWLRQDLPSRLQRRIEMPVTVVTSTARS